MSAAPVLCVDLDGTLVRTDTLWESLVRMLKTAPWRVVAIPLWLMRGKAHLKRRLADVAPLDPAALPYREDLLGYLRSKKVEGTEIVLATGADRAIAQAIADHLQLFSAVLSSDGSVNLVGEAKRQAIERFAAGRPFAYVGNSQADLPVWRSAVENLLVGAPPGVREAVERNGALASTSASRPRSVHDWFRALRLNHWAKNVLLFVPLLTSHRVTDLNLVALGLTAFVSFSFAASGMYLWNDLLDLEADRRHTRKRNRPIASGAITPAAALLATSVLLTGSLLVALLLPRLFTALLLIYIFTAGGYSLFFKRLMVADVLLLAGLYTIRVLAGGVATGIPISQWLLAFSVFIFVSLAFAKRFSELLLMQEAGLIAAGGRDYVVGDLDLIRTVGVGSGLLSILVLALYISSREVTVLYRNPLLLWLICPLLFYWIVRLWFTAHRGGVADDPLIYTLKDRMSYALAGAVGLIALLAL